MAKRAAKGDRNDPRDNKSLAIRTILERMPNAKAREIIDAVKTQYGHDVTGTLVYLVKSKANIRKTRRSKAPGERGAAAPMNSAKTWTDAIRSAQHLLKSTGSLDNAIAVLRAVEVREE